MTAAARAATAIQSGTTSAGTTTTTTTTPETVVGDITLDGTVNVKDMILLIQYLSGEKVDSKGKDFKAGDVNGDGTLNGLDLALYRQGIPELRRWTDET